MTDAPTIARKPTSLVKNLAVMYGAQIITMLLSLAPIAYVPVYLNADGLGKVTAAFSLASLLGTLVMVGTANYIVREIARDRTRLAELLWSGVALRGLLALALLPIAVLSSYALGYPAETRAIVQIIYVAAAIRMIGQTFASALQALEKMAWLAMVAIIWETFSVVVGWSVLRGGGGVTGYATVMILSNIVELLIYLAFFVVVAPTGIVVRPGAMVQLFRGGLPFLLWIVLQTVYIQTNTLFLSKLAGDEAVGWYGAAARFTTPLYAIPSIAITVLLPRFALVHNSAAETFRATVTRALNYILILTLPMAIGIGAVAADIINLFDYPPSFQHSIAVLRVLALSLPLTSLSMVLATGAAAMKAERVWSRVSLASLVSLVTLNAFMIPLGESYLRNPAAGAALALVLAEVVTLVAALYLFARTMIERSFLVTLFKSILACAGMVVALLLLDQASLVLRIVLGASVYAGAALALDILPSEDRQRVQCFVVDRWRPASMALRARLARTK